MIRPDQANDDAKREELLALLLQEQGLEAARSHAIPRREDSYPPPASSAQQRLWFLHEMDPESPVYNIPRAIRLNGPLDVQALECALREMVGRHQALRTTLRMANGDLIQVIAPSPSGILEQEDWQHLDIADQASLVEQRIMSEARRPFDLTQGPLVRAVLLRLAEQEHLLLLTMHHVVSDGWSMGIFNRELSLAYRAFKEGRPSRLFELPIQYADYAEWQQDRQAGEADLAYWKEQLAGSLPLLELPGKPRPAVRTLLGDTFSFRLSRSLTDGILSLCRRQGVTPFMALLASFNVLLHRYTGQQDILVGTPIANRSVAEVEGLIGFFVNTLVLRSDLSGDPSFVALLERVRQVALAAYEHQDVPFEKLVEVLQPERSASHSPLFQVMFVLQNTPTPPLELAGIAVAPIDVHTGTSKFDLTLVVEETDDGFACQFEYNTDLFEPEMIARMSDHWQVLLEGIVAQPRERLSRLPLLTRTERQRLLVEWNETAVESPEGVYVHTLFERQAARTPEASAVVFEGRQLSYYELNERANQMAHFLRAHGVGPEIVVGVCLERSVEQFIALIGILKSGGAFLPLDPTFPKRRLVFMLGESRAPVVLTQASLAGQFSEGKAKIICMDTEWHRISQESRENPVNQTSPEAMAYVIYTSGSTGAPKGVAVEHRSVVNLSVALRKAVYQDGAVGALRISVNGPLTFDTSIKQFIQLLSGHSLYLIPSEVRFDGRASLDLIRNQHLDVFDCTPAQLELLLGEGLLTECGGAPGRVLVAGESIDLGMWRRLAESTRTVFYNLYGPTECTVDTTGTRIYPLDVPTIGRPLAGARIYILDRHLEPVPVGVPGELYIGGAGLARGYLNRPDLTAERFIPDPFGHEPGGRLYGTGDLARYLENGEIECLGRIDEQVKVRGFRIELGEIEAALAECLGTSQVAAVASEAQEGTGEEHGRASSKRLVACIAVPREALPPLSELRARLKERLPDYMIPSAFVSVDALPLTPNGKVDRRALASMQVARLETEEEFVSPRTNVERVLARIWTDVLKIERVGIRDNFFELGGDSILGIQVIARANQAGVKLAPRHLFQYQTIAELAEVAGSSATNGAHQYVVTGPVPLTPIQQRFLERNLPEPEHWNMAMLLEAERPLDPVLLERAVEYLNGHHDALRLRVARTEEGWQQFNGGLEAKIAYSHIDLSAVSAIDQVVTIEEASREFQASLDLWRGPLARVVFFNRGPERPSLVLVIIHHLVVDGVSWRVLLEDLQTAYEQLGAGEPIHLPPKTMSFKEWAEQLTDYAQSPILRQEAGFWLARREPSGRLPVDFPEGTSANTEASERMVTISLGAGETRALVRQALGAMRVQINDVLLTALAQTMAKWMGSRSLLLDLEGHGREPILEDADLSRTVGWFTTVFPVLLEVDEAAPVQEAVRRVKEQLDRIPKRGIGYGLLRYLSRDRAIKEELIAQPQAEVAFNYLGQFDQNVAAGPLFRPAFRSSVFESTLEYGGSPRSLKGQRQYLLAVTGSITGGRLAFQWTFSENVHRRATIEALARGFAQALRAIIAQAKGSSSGAFQVRTSDLTLVKMSQAALDQLIGRGEPVEDIYPLSPGQREMLANVLEARGKPVYVLQSGLSLHGDLNVPAFKWAWQQVIDRFSALRTAFAWTKPDEPLQIVYRHTEPAWDQQDWRDLEPKDQAERLEVFLRTDRERGFLLDQPPLMRFALIRLAESTYRFIWSHHHLILDGWSVGPLWRQVQAFYGAAVEGRELHPEEASSYCDYIAWLQQQDVSKAKEFWIKALKGAQELGRLPACFEGDNPGAPDSFAEESLALSAAATGRMRDASRHHRLTLSTWVQGAWAIALSHDAGQEAVLYGVTVSGRPAGLAGVESIVGLFANTLPVWVEVPADETLLTWLRRLQDHQAELRQYDYVSLEQIREWSATSHSPMFDTFLRFQNYPLQESLWKSDLGDMEIRDVDGIDWWHYALGGVAVPGQELLLRIVYDTRRVARAAVKKMLSDLRTLLEAFAANPEQSLRELRLCLEGKGN